MSDALKLSSALPGKEEINGLDALAEKLAEDPAQMLCSIIIWDVKDVRYIPDLEAHVPTLRFRRGEAWLVSDTPEAIRQALVERTEKRTNSTPLPFGEVEVKTKAAAGEECDHSDMVDFEDPGQGAIVGKQCSRCGLIERYAPEDYEYFDCECGHSFADHDLDSGECSVTSDDPAVTWAECPCGRKSAAALSVVK